MNIGVGWEANPDILHIGTLRNWNTTIFLRLTPNWLEVLRVAIGLLMPLRLVSVTDCSRKSGLL